MIFNIIKTIAYIKIIKLSSTTSIKLAMEKHFKNAIVILLFYDDKT